MKCKFWKLNSSIPYIDELTVFINVKIEILKEFSKEIPKKVSKDDKNSIDIIKIKTDRKYLLIIILSRLMSKNNCLLLDIFFGLTWEIKLLMENLNNT